MDFTQSIAFVEAKGTSLEKARLSCILHGTSPQKKVIQGFIELQNDGWGVPIWDA